MISALLLLASLSLGLKGPEARFQAGQADFNRGNFSAALRQLDTAAAEAKDEKMLAQIHLLRGQAYAAKGDYERVEGAFFLALEADPEATLDPARVDPRVVGILDGVRARMAGKLQISAPPGTRVSVDSRPAGVSPLSLELPIGRHQVEGRSPDGRKVGKSEVLVRSKKSTEVELALVPRSEGRDSKSEGHSGLPQESDSVTHDKGLLQPFADLRPAWAPAELLGGLGFEVGGGVEREWVRVQLSARLVQYFGITPRAAFHIPLLPKLEGLVEGEVPILFPSSVAVGVGAGGGAEYAVIPWVGAFAQAGFRYYFVRPDYNFPQSQFLLQLGVRLRLPH